MPLAENEQSILDGVAAGLIVVAPDRTVARWNTWMVSASGRPSAAVAGKTIAEAFPGTSVDRLERAIESALVAGASTMSSLRHSLTQAPTGASYKSSM
jgi:hypothetical protein